MQTSKASAVFITLAFVASLGAALGQPSITFLALRGQPQTPFDQPLYGRHFYIPLPLITPDTHAPAAASRFYRAVSQ